MTPTNEAVVSACQGINGDGMTERELELLEVLAEKMPVRFGFGRDLDGEFFHDAELGGMSFYFSSPEFWVMRVFESLDIAYVWREEGRTWRESILNAIVHRLTGGDRHERTANTRETG